LSLRSDEGTKRSGPAGGYVGSSVETRVDAQAAATDNAHFRTDHLVENIGQLAVSGGFVTVGAQGAKFLLNFLAAAVLARLLSAKDFGLVGMVLGITSLVAVLSQLGLSIATIQREKITQAQVSNLFWINVGTSAILAMVSFALSPLAARFYHDPRVTGIMLALSTTFLLAGSTVQHQALLTRQMRFGALALIDVTSTAFGFALACFLAWRGFAYWALVAQQLGTSSCSLMMTWLTSGWRPHWPSRNSGVKPLLKFGVHLSVADFLAQLSLNSDSILLGRFFGAEPLGLYTRANVLLTRPVQQVMIPINSVLTPVLSRLQTDPKRYRRSLMKAYDTLALIVFSFAAMCFVLAKPMVLVILGPKWYGVIPLFTMFSLVAVSGPLSYICPWIYESQARGQDQLWNHTLAGGVTIISYLLGLHWGPIGVVTSLAIISFVIRLPLVYYIAGRSGPVGTGDLWMGFLSHLPCWGMVFLTTTLAYKLVEHSRPIIQLLVSVPLGLAAGAALILLFPRPRRSLFFAWRTARVALLDRFTATNPSS
jgi:O-antigen/teichoic acid export membrane protein